MNGPKQTHTGHEYSTRRTNTRTQAAHTAQHAMILQCTMTSGGDQQLISGKLSRFFDEDSRCSNMSSCSMHALTLRMMSFLTVRALSPRLQARGTNVRVVTFATTDHANPWRRRGMRASGRAITSPPPPNTLQSPVPTHVVIRGSSPTQ